ncbi:MAG: hypothetical protein B6I30_07615 [Desulfobacteraceae bacterium 4572_187]|nr:MAG: hypothetical protein B6I30_07615 [Desulfobacteraceae bacterium 4572_187]
MNKIKKIKLVIISWRQINKAYISSQGIFVFLLCLKLVFAIVKKTMVCGSYKICAEHGIGSTFRYG